MAYYRTCLITVMVLFLILDGLAVAGRLYVRLRITKGFWYDDMMLALTYLGYIMMCVVGFTAFYYGYAAEAETAYSKLKPWYDPVKAKKFYFANQLTDYICSGLVKLAVALVLYRLCTTKALKRTLTGSMIVVVMWTVVMTVYAADLCATKGASNYAGSHTCNIVGYFRTSTNIAIDYFYALLPIYILWNVQMGWKTKVSAMVLLGMGIFASASTIVKLVIIIRLNHAKGVATESLHYQLLLWADIELGLAILAASLAALRPLLVRWNIFQFARSGGQGTRTGNTGLVKKYQSGASDATGPYNGVGNGGKRAIVVHRDVHLDMEMEDFEGRDGRVSKTDSQQEILRAAHGRWTP